LAQKAIWIGRIWFNRYAINQSHLYMILSLVIR